MGNVWARSDGSLSSIRSYVDAISGQLNPNVVSATTYYPFGPANQFNYGNGRTLAKAYDRNYAIDKVTSTGASSLTLDMSVDVLGNLTDTSSTVGASPPTVSYTYDPLFRVTNVKNGSGTSLESYSYNNTGDRLTKTNSGGLQTYTYSSPLTSHRVQSVAGASRTYFADGSAKSIGATTLSYDDRGRLAIAGNGEL